MINQKIDEFLEGLNPKSVLDLGCGKGRITKRFARKNIPVVGIDFKNQEIELDKFTFVQKNILDYKFEKKFDLIVTSLVLHFFDKNISEELIFNMKQNTEINGYNFLICMSNLDDLSKNNENKFYPSLEILKELYSDWEIVKCEQVETDKETHNNQVEEHTHNLILFLVKKKN